MSLLSNCLLFLYFLLSLQGQLPDQSIYLIAAVLLLFLEFFGHVLALAELHMDNLVQFLLLLLPGH